ncbi:MAG: hypothetical protein AABX07_01395 [Nanoarchaeota archaeon]
MPRESQTSKLLSKLPIVEMKEGVRVFQRAEIEFGGSGYKKMVYVAGKCLHEGEEHLVYGDGLGRDNRIAQEGNVFDAIPFSQIRRYSPLKKR